MFIQLLKKKHYFIGGGTGFIGSNLTEMLLREGYKVTTISRFDLGKKDVISWVIVYSYSFKTLFLSMFFIKNIVYYI